VLAESIATGQGYRLINFPNAPTERTFPPGWPLLLATIVAAFPGNYTPLKLMSLILWLMSIPLVYRLFSSRLGTPYLEILVALVALNPRMIRVSGMVMSEAAFLFFSLLTLNVLEYWDTCSDKNWILVVIVGVLAVYTQLIRTVGLSVVLTVTAYLLVSRRFRQLAIAIVVIGLGMFPQLWLNFQDGGSLISSGYESQVLGISFTEKTAQMWDNAQSYFHGLISISLEIVFRPNTVTLFNRIGLGIIPPAVNALVVLLIVAGAILSTRCFKASDLYAGLYFAGVLAFWNPKVGSAQARFLIPLVPFLYFYLIQAVARLTYLFIGQISRNKKAAPLVVIALLTPIVLSSIAFNIQEWQDPMRNRITDLSIGTRWILQNTPQDSVVMAQDPVPDYLYARRKTIAYPSIEQDIQEYLDANNVDYVLVSPRLQMPRTKELGEFAEAKLVPFLTSSPDRFRLVYTNSVHNVTVYEVGNNE
jgi:hypothetical protein